MRRTREAVGSNSTAILTDAFPADQRGMALGINQVAGLAVAVVMSLVAAAASMLRGGRYVHEDSDADRIGGPAQDAAASGVAAPGTPLEDDPPEDLRTAVRLPR